VPKIHETITINKPRPAVFAFAHSQKKRLLWDSFSKDFQYLNSASRADPGVIARTRMWHGLTMDVEYISFHEPAVAAMKMVRGPFFFRKFAGSWRFDDIGDQRTRVHFIYHFQSRWPRLRFAVDYALRLAISKDVRRRLRDLKNALETPAIAG